jgi:hypothetical protein
MVKTLGGGLEQVGNNMSRCAETMQKQLSSILKVINFFKDLILPADVKEKLKKEIEILAVLEKEKELQMAEMRKMAEGKESTQDSI